MANRPEIPLYWISAIRGWKNYIPKTGIIILASLSLGVVLALDYSSSERQILIRYMMFLQAGVMAFMTPWILFPQKPIWTIQTLNPSPFGIAKLMGLRMAGIWVFWVFLFGGISMGGTLDVSSEWIATWFNSMLYSTGIILFSVSRFINTGIVSQQWQEGVRGKAFMDYLREAGSPGAPAGAYPTLGISMQVAVAGMLTVVAGAWLNNTYPVLPGAITGLLLLIPAMISIGRKKSMISSYFYQTHAFYSELFRNPGGKSEAGRDPLPYESLYWVPSTFRPLLWMMLRQIDRKIPMGRLLILGFVSWWVVLRADQPLVSLDYLLPVMLILVKNIAVHRVEWQPYSSGQFQRNYGSNWQWFGVRIFGSLRWTPPLHLFTLITIGFVSVLNIQHWFYWLYIDLISILLISAVVSMWKSVEIKKQFA